MAEYLKYQTIGVSADAIWESENGRVVLQVSKAAALHCELRRGSPEQRPLVSAGLGLFLFLPGLFFGPHAVTFFENAPSRFFGRFGMALYFTTALGVWLLFRAAFRKRTFIAVATNDGEVRLIFEGTSQLSEIRQFLSEAETQFGWHIRDTLPRNA